MTTSRPSGASGCGLPDEIWLRILAFLTQEELCVAGLVCRGMLHLTRDPTLWTRVSLLEDAVASTDCVVGLLHRVPLLTEFRITRRDDSEELLAALALHCPRLARLEVVFCQPISYSSLAGLVRGCPALHTLNLQFTGLLNKYEDQQEREGSTGCLSCPEQESFCYLLGQFRQLADLNLFTCNLHSSGLELLATHCTNLTKLNIDEVQHLSDESFNNLIEVRGPSLKMLELEGESLSDESFVNFHKMRQLERLSISFCENLGPAGLHSIAKIANLEWLKLRYGLKLAPEDWVAAFRQADGLGGSLLHLDLEMCHTIDDSGIKAIASACPNLVTIRLEGCSDITDAGLVCLVNKCKSLTHLHLAWLSQLLGEFLPRINIRLPGLRLLDLEMCDLIEVEMLEELAGQKDDLFIKGYFGDQVRAAELEIIFRS